jgi:hypothetical protein
LGRLRSPPRQREKLHRPLQHLCRHHQPRLDKHGAGLTFHGAVASTTTLIPNIDIEPFLLVRTAPRVLSHAGTYGSEVEVTPGIFAAGTLPAGFDVSLTGDLQRGAYSSDSFHAGAAIVKVGFLVPHLPWTPRIQGEYDYATGDPHRNAGRIGTYDQLYPSNHNAFGLVDLFGFQNIEQHRINLALLPCKNLSLLFQASSLHLASVRDNVYNSTGKTLVKVPPSGFASDDLGTESDASAKLIVNKFFVINIGTGHLFPGAAMTHNGHAASTTLGYLSLTYRFTVNKHAPSPDVETNATSTTNTTSGLKPTP